MSLSDLAALGSFVSGIAVVLSFAFLALQLRQSNVNQRATIQMQRASRGMDVMFRRYTDPRLMDISRKGHRGDISMPPDDVQTYLRMNLATLLGFEDTYLQNRLGTIDPDAWKDALGRLTSFFASPGARVSWKKWRSQFQSGFAESVDQIVAQARLSPWEEEAASWASDVDEELRLSAK